jgi:hypothetical protein
MHSSHGCETTRCRSIRFGAIVIQQSTKPLAPLYSCLANASGGLATPDDGSTLTTGLST